MIVVKKKKKRRHFCFTFHLIHPHVLFTAEHSFLFLGVEIFSHLFKDKMLPVWENKEMCLSKNLSTSLQNCKKTDMIYDYKKKKFYTQ